MAANLKKQTAQVLIIVMLVTTFIATYGEFNRSYAGTYGVIAEEVELKSAPGMDNNEGVLTVPAGEKVEILDEIQLDSQKWYKVKYDTAEGYITEESIHKDGEVENEAVEEEKSFSEENAVQENDEQKALLSDNLSNEKYKNTYGKTTDDQVNLRREPGTKVNDNAPIAHLPINAEFKVLDDKEDPDGDLWYYIDWNGQKGYIYSGIVTLFEKGESVPDAAFESSIQSFPESYRAGLRQLHTQYPSWQFVAKDTGLKWGDVIEREFGTPGRVNERYNLIHKSAKDEWKSKEPADYYPGGSPIEYDSGGYVAASRSAIEYYMDPRNFFDSSSIFQFMSSQFVPGVHNAVDLQDMLKDTFMEGSIPGEGVSYSDVIMEAAAASNVSPYTIAAMILQEQGPDGRGGCINGKLDGQPFYNYFNVGAVSGGGRNAVENGLRYAKEQGWTTRRISILEGAKWYGRDYINNNQYTLYLKKFNVMNGASKVASHQYMTNVQGAYSEAVKLRKAYTTLLNSNLVFDIPVYEGMSGDISVVRLWGKDRYDTSIETVEFFKSQKNISKLNSIIVASGNDYPDALSGSYLSKVKDAPILLINPSNTEKAESYIRSNLETGGKVYILGGSGAVPTSFEASMRRYGYNIKRFNGRDRYETNTLILKECGVNNQDLMICSGNGFADALAASAVGKPIMLVGDELTKKQRDYLHSIHVADFYVIGGTGVISSEVQYKLRNYTEGSIERIAGMNRFETSVEVAEKFFGTGINCVTFAYAMDFPDGLSASPVARNCGSPLLLIDKRNTEAATNYLSGIELNKIILLGGQSLISDSLINSII